MIKSVISKLSLALYFILGALVLELLTFKLLNLGVVPQYFMLNFSLILIVALIIYCIPNYTAQYVIYTIILLVQAVFIYINYSLYSIYGDLFSFDMLKLVREATEAITSSFIFVNVMFQLIAIFLALALCGFVILHYCKKSKIKIKQHYSVFNIIILIGIQFLSCGYYFYERNYINNISNLDAMNYVDSDTFLMNTNFLKENSYSKFGTYGYWLNLLINEVPIPNKSRNNATINFFKTGQTYNDSAVFGADQGNNVIVIMMESLEWFAFSNGDIYSLDEDEQSFYDYQKTLNNLSYELTPNIYALIKGEDYLQDLTNQNTANDGLLAQNFFAKSKTNISEGQGIIGNYPVGETLTSLVSNKSFEYSIPNVLKTKNYTTSYVHSNVISFYSRNETHKYLGFDYVTGKDGVCDSAGNKIYTGNELEWDNWDAEADFAANAIDYIIPVEDNSKPFYTFYLNVSTHGAYTDENNKNDGDALRYYDYVIYGKNNCNIVDEKGNKFYFNGQQINDVATLRKHYPNEKYFWKLKYSGQEKETWLKNTPDQQKYSTYYNNILNNFKDFKQDENIVSKLVYYECGVMGLDEAIGVIISNLKQRDMLNKTTLMLYSDHYCYYDSISNNVKGFDTNDTASIELNTIPMIISSPGIKNLQATSNQNFATNNRFCSAYDIAPTILDLLGIEFNQNLYMGNSLFKPLNYVYVLDETTHLARDVLPNEEGTDMVVYYSNTGGLFSKDLYTYNLTTFYDSVGNVCTDQKLIQLFKSEASVLLTKLNYLHILNKYHLYQEL